MPDEQEILEVLDQQWASVAQIRSRLGPAGRSLEFASILAEMAEAGTIDRAFTNTTATKRGRGGTKPLRLSFYRRRGGSIGRG
jgi:hypothetical protein